MHYINTYITVVIIVMIGTLKSESIDKEIGQILLTSILDKILSFSRIESISYIMHLKKGPTLISLGE